MAAIRKIRPPAGAATSQLAAPGDFLDGYAVTSALTPRAAATLGMALPGWALALLRLRNALVRPLGLRTEAPSGAAAIGMFPILRDDAAEFLMGFDDRHLDFRISVARDGDNLNLSTWVRPHNAFGRLYLALVMPFHIMIVRGAARRMAG